MVQPVLQFSHTLLQQSVSHGEIVIDATCGNGNDTLFLSKLVGDTGKVYAFDIQQQAIYQTQQLLADHKRNNTILIQDSHANMQAHIGNQEIAGAIFNLGYLPKGDKTIITKKDVTISAVTAILRQLKHGGHVVLVVYYGHPGGKEEKAGLLHFAAELDQKHYHVLKYEFINQQNNPPFVLAIQKR
ncbi:class I SAM-dependent methyltransferase [Virgibacillus sp. 179-BFC.A HS]|uniref:Class I SAM-dependent methyltransferase n=1 Tax=Tigheibacillus jepli TaxID=3035914 RepID=A0ABU5CHJ7_9BACI|nr:class I SAM-dependent methyltransferase [Virgibacillus sp. 179-BFC.A HS]MDY0405284.1 class I SAM-dependent methyltransferase [Virgibacillus sp. 179-BFC.A HS]